MEQYVLAQYVTRLEEHDLLLGSSELPLTQPVQLVSCDSRETVAGTLFLCKGRHFKPEFLRQAANSGAIAYLSETIYPEIDLPYMQVRDIRQTLALVADFYYQHPSGRLDVIGITGTKGKSSTTYYVKYILDEALAAQDKGESGIISSIDTYDGINRFESHLTTPEPLELQRHFSNAISSGIPYLSMEVSSQALKYHRTLYTRFAVACFLNISPDHISPIEHPNFDDYFASKLKIFQQADCACINLDCERAEEILAAAQHSGLPLITFSQKNPSADVYADHVKKQGNDILFHVRSQAYDRTFRLTMPGLFNVENALAAIAICQSLHIAESYLYAGLMKARVPGRMEVYANADQTVTAIVDYAHNKISFQTLFQSVREEYPGRKITAVFGCPGGKAFDRRRDLGIIAGQYADRVILTEEDAGEEDPKTIGEEIAQYVLAQGCRYDVIPNRGEAIRRAILDCQELSVLLITGKGAETRQKRGLQYIDCPSDVEYVHTFLQEYDMLHHLDGLENVRGLARLAPILNQERGHTIVFSAEPDAMNLGTVRADIQTLECLGIPVRRLIDHTGLIKRFVFLSSGGVRLDSRNQKTALEYADAKYASELLEAGLITGESAYQVRQCLLALKCGAQTAAILDARSEHVLLLAAVRQKIDGTIFVQDNA